MKTIILTTTCFLVQFVLPAQEASVKPAQVFSYISKFQEFIGKQKNADSALFCLRELSKDSKGASQLSMLVHVIFAQDFYPEDNVVNQERLQQKQQQRRFAKEILVKGIQESNSVLYNHLHPLYLVAQAQDAKNNIGLLEQIAKEFVETELSKDKLYAYKTARYGLLIHQLLTNNIALEKIDQKLFSTIFTYLQNNQIVGTVTTDRDELDKRGYLRYLYAAANYLEAERTHNADAKQAFLKNAFIFSPDLIDKNNRSSYFYEQFFLFPGNGKESFKDEYISLLMKQASNKEKLLPLLLQTALIEPAYKTKLQEFYNANKTGATDFKTYWNNAINDNAIASPMVSLTGLKKEHFSSKPQAGKWIMIDFWGTWCGPCRKEHPDLQKFYDSTVLPNKDKLSLFTIACRDEETAVTTYMAQKKFSFPVAMSDNEVENKFLVKGYPTKILINPQGKYVVIPFGSDWINFVKQYCDL